MANIFLGTEVEPTAFEIALQQLYLSGLARRVAETGDLSSAVDATLGFKRDADGNLVELTEQERFDSLSPIEQTNYNLFKQQSAELEKAFAGEETEAQKQRSMDKARILNEGLSRRGGPGATNLASSLKDLIGLNTPAIQSIAEAERGELLARSKENEDRKVRLSDTVFNASGLLSKFNTQNITNLTNAPRRFDVGGCGGLLANTGEATRNTADSQSGINQEIFDIGAGLLGSFLPIRLSDERFKKDVRPLESALGNILKLRGINYKFKVDEFPDKGFTEGDQIGFIAQELEEVYPELVHTDGEGFKSVRYDLMTAVLVEAVKGLNDRLMAIEDKKEELIQVK